MYTARWFCLISWTSFDEQSSLVGYWISVTRRLALWNIYGSLTYISLLSNCDWSTYFCLQSFVEVCYENICEYSKVRIRSFVHSLLEAGASVYFGHMSAFLITKNPKQPSLCRVAFVKHLLIHRFSVVSFAFADPLVLLSSSDSSSESEEWLNPMLSRSTTLLSHVMRKRVLCHMRTAKAQICVSVGKWYYVWNFECICIFCSLIREFWPFCWGKEGANNFAVCHFHVNNVDAVVGKAS